MNKLLTSKKKLLISAVSLEDHVNDLDRILVFSGSSIDNIVQAIEVKSHLVMQA